VLRGASPVALATPWAWSTSGSVKRVQAVGAVIAVGWAVLILFWFVAAFSTKRSHAVWSAGLRIRVVIAAAVLALIRLGVLRAPALDTDALRAAVGLTLFGLGLMLAVWARVQLGRNWGTPMSTKDDPELVRSGPYRLIRHPIYTGIVAAGAGTAIALNWHWLILVGLVAGYFVHAARVEERYLQHEFPETYPAYQHSTKMLLPFIF